MEDELKKTKQSYDTQISAHEKKAHNNWVRPREPFISTELKKKENCRIKKEKVQYSCQLTSMQHKVFPCYIHFCGLAALFFFLLLTF